MSSNAGSGDGKRAIAATRDGGEFSTHALDSESHNNPQQDAQHTAIQKIAAVAGVLSSTDSTPTGTPAAKRTNVSATPIQNDSDISIEQQQQAIMAAMQSSNQAMAIGAERRAEELRAGMEGDRGSEYSARFERARHNCTLPHASPMPSGMALHTVLL
jgi:hypothetical protein